MGLLIDGKNREHRVVCGVALGLPRKTVHVGRYVRKTFQIESHVSNDVYLQLGMKGTTINMDYKVFLQHFSFQESLIIIMSPFIVAFIAFILYFVFRILNIASQPRKPEILCKDEKFAALLKECAPELEQLLVILAEQCYIWFLNADHPFFFRYVPTRIWGFSGHIQTVMHSLIGRKKCPWPIGERVSLLLDDGATLTYDVYQPLAIHSSGGNSQPIINVYQVIQIISFLPTEDVTLVLCPGICNSSESIYIRTFVHHAQRQGYRCVAINHIGAMKSIKLTSHRIFSYGCTKDFHEMVTSVQGNYLHTKMVLVGFSMGANIVTKYMGEKRPDMPKNIMGGISVCQGYDALGYGDNVLFYFLHRIIVDFNLCSTVQCSTCCYGPISGDSTCTS